MTAATAADLGTDPAPQTNRRERPIAVLLLVGGLVGLAAAFVLAVEKFLLLTNPLYVPTCSINATFSCGSVMTSPQAEAFGFPNPLLGLVGFTVVAATGAALLAGAQLAGWYWAGLQIGATIGAVFVHWLIIQSAFVIGALCPYCMVVWAVALPIFWYVTLRNLTVVGGRTKSGAARAAISFAQRYHSALLGAWLAALAALIAVAFWPGGR